MHQFKSGDYIMVKNHESERWTHGCVDVVLSQKNAILCSKRTRHANSERLKSPFIIELGIFHGTDAHRIGFSH